MKKLILLAICATAIAAVSCKSNEEKAKEKADAAYQQGKELASDAYQQGMEMAGQQF